MSEHPVKITKAAFERTVGDLRQIAGEPVTVRFMSNAFWAFGSELASLRLLAKHRNLSTEKVRHGFSESLKMHYFVLETPGIGGEEMSTEGVVRAKLPYGVEITEERRDDFDRAVQTARENMAIHKKVALVPDDLVIVDMRTRYAVFKRGETPDGGEPVAVITPAGAFCPYEERNETQDGVKI